MLLMAIALLLPQDLPAVSPGLCLAAGDQIKSVTDIVRGRLEDDARAEGEGRSHKYEAGQRKRMMELLERDARDAVKVQRRFAGASPSQAERDQIEGMQASEVVGYLRLCAAA
jgi:hypothetical protein